MSQCLSQTKLASLGAAAVHHQAVWLHMLVTCTVRYLRNLCAVFVKSGLRDSCFPCCVHLAFVSKMFASHQCCCHLNSPCTCSPSQSRPVSAGKPPRPTSAGGRPLSGRLRPTSATLAPILEDSYASQSSITSGRASPLFPEAAFQKSAGIIHVQKCT